MHEVFFQGQFDKVRIKVLVHFSHVMGHVSVSVSLFSVCVSDKILEHCNSVGGGWGNRPVRYK